MAVPSYNYSAWDWHTSWQQCSSAIAVYDMLMRARLCQLVQLCLYCLGGCIILAKPSMAGIGDSLLLQPEMFPAFAKLEHSLCQVAMKPTRCPEASAQSIRRILTSQSAKERGQQRRDVRQCSQAM